MSISPGRKEEEEKEPRKETKDEKSAAPEREGLSESEKNISQLWYASMQTLFQNDPESFAMLKEITEKLCDTYHIILEPVEQLGDVKLSMAALSQIWTDMQALVAGNDEIDREAIRVSMRQNLEEQLGAWALAHKAAESAASHEFKEMAESNPGIYDCIMEGKAIPPNAWLTDRDVQKFFTGIMVKNVGEITKPGKYVLTPLSLAGAGADSSLENRLAELTKGKKYQLQLLPEGAPVSREALLRLQKSGDVYLAYKPGESVGREVKLSESQIGSLVFPTIGNTIINHDQESGRYVKLIGSLAEQLGLPLKVPGEVTLLTPANDSDAHWRLGITSSKDAKLVSATLWDSMKDLTDKYLAYQNMQINIENASLSSPVRVKIEASGIQTNFKSCADFMIRKILQLCPELKGEFFDAIRMSKSSEPEVLRQLIINQIIASNPELKAKVAPVREGKDDEEKGRGRGRDEEKDRGKGAGIGEVDVRSILAAGTVVMRNYIAAELEKQGGLNSQLKIEAAINDVVRGLVEETYNSAYSQVQIAQHSGEVKDEKADIDTVLDNYMNRLVTNINDVLAAFNYQMESEQAVKDLINEIVKAHIETVFGPPIIDDTESLDFSPKF